MKIEALLLSGAALTSVVGGAFAGEDSTHRLHGVGPAWYEIKDGLRKLAAEAPDAPAPTNQAASGSVKTPNQAGSPAFSKLSR